MKVYKLKCKKTGGKAFPNDFNWECPTCKSSNRAYQLPRQERFSRADLEAACDHCSSEKWARENPGYVIRIS